MAIADAGRTARDRTRLSAIAYASRLTVLIETGLMLLRRTGTLFHALRRSGGEHRWSPVDPVATRTP